MKRFWAAAALLALGEEDPNAWPKLLPARQEEFYAKLALYKRAAADKAPQVGREIAAYGKGVVPLLLGALGKAEPEARPRLLTLLDALTDAADAGRLLKEGGSKTPLVRAYALRRASLFAGPEHAAAFEKALADDDKENRFYASLGTSRGGSLAGLGNLVSEANARWDGQKKEILAAIGGIRGAEATKKLLSLIGPKEDDQALAALRLLGGAGDSSALTAIAPFLDSTNNRLKEEAVNALRGIVDRAPPLENLSVFDLIEQAKAWKAKLKGGGGKKG